MQGITQKISVMAKLTSGDTSLWVDVCSFSAVFARNTIPMATITVPLGRELKTLLPSNVHQISPAVDSIIEIAVYAKINNITNLIFFGWLTNVHYQRTFASASAKLVILHWLSALTFSSAISKSSAVSNPDQFSFPTALRVLPGPGVQVAQTGPQQAMSVSTPDNITTDLWSNVWRPWFLWLASQDRIFGTIFSGEKNKNDSADNLSIQALNAIYSAGLGLDLSGGDEQALSSVAVAIARDMGSGMTGVGADELSMANLTFWDKIIKHFVPSYMFDIIPRVSTALAAPVFPCLRNYYKLILARDYIFVDFTSKLNRPLRGVGIFSETTNLGPNVRLNPVAQLGLGGYFEGRADGIVLFKQTPSFLSGLHHFAQFTDIALELSQTRSNSANFPKAGKNNEKKATGVLESLPPILNRVAAAFYYEEVLRNRTAVLVSPLRFDICPGSIIGVQAPTSKFVGNIDSTRSDWCGCVEQIEITISNEEQNRTALTTFNFSHVRSLVENMSDSLTADRHPLYKTSWSGASLLG